MSRIGKLPIAIPSGVEVKVGADVVEVKGAKAALTTPVCDLLSYEVADGHITLTRKAETRESRAQHGLRRTLLANCIEGVTKGFSKTLEVIGVGYRVAVKGNVIELQVGFSTLFSWNCLLDCPRRSKVRSSPSWALTRSSWAKWPLAFAASASLNPIRARASSTKPKPSCARPVSPAARVNNRGAL